MADRLREVITDSMRKHDLRAESVAEAVRALLSEVISPLNHACPICLAEPQEPCQWQGSEDLESFHGSRYMQADQSLRKLIEG